MAYSPLLDASIGDFHIYFSFLLALCVLYGLTLQREVNAWERTGKITHCMQVICSSGENLVKVSLKKRLNEEWNGSALQKICDNMFIQPLSILSFNAAIYGHFAEADTL